MIVSYIYLSAAIDKFNPNEITDNQQTMDFLAKRDKAKRDIVTASQIDLRDIISRIIVVALPLMTFCAN
jgi:hypothetical protein